MMLPKKVKAVNLRKVICPNPKWLILHLHKVHLDSVLFEYSLSFLNDLAYNTSLFFFLR